jgi:lipid II:glycine glycyltransferase (peptidoglycan interpeptide bridge formation enzyme)
LQVAPSDRWPDFWCVLQENLHARHDVRPVHTLDEIRLLASRFPDEIRLFVVGDGHSVLAGTVIYETATTAHAQYIGSSVAGQQTGALDLLFGWLIDEHYAGCKDWFDFGISTEQGGQVLNEGLLAFKEGFGARAVCYEHWLLPCAQAEV